MEIVAGDFADARVVDLLRIHLDTARAATGPHSAHALDLCGLQSPDISFWAIRDAEAVLGVGALKRLSASEGEIKSMHIAERARRRGAATAMLRHLIATAGQNRMSRLFLETGAWDYFNPARSLYGKHGFVICGPFAGYRPDPNSVFMTLALPPSA